MSTDFKIQNYGDPEDQIIPLTRKQIEQMAEMINHFKEIDTFQLRISNAGGLKQSLHFTFNLDLNSVGK
jgi:hypothetical protein